MNSIGAEVLEFISDYGKPTSPLPAAIVACVPKKAHTDGLGETEFKLTASEIITAIEAGLEEPIEAEPEVSCSLILSFSFTLKYNISVCCLIVFRWNEIIYTSAA